MRATPVLIAAACVSIALVDLAAREIDDSRFCRPLIPWVDVVVRAAVSASHPQNAATRSMTQKLATAPRPYAAA